MFDISSGSYSDTGDVRQINQDSVLCRTGVFGKRSVGLFIVADGCGGLSFGEEISKLAASYFDQLWNIGLKGLICNKKSTDDDIIEYLEKAISEINKSAMEFSQQVNEQVGTTLSVLLVIENKYYIKNIGDSRIYLIRRGEIQQVTEDQSLVAQMLRNNELTAEEAKSFKQKNALTMCVGFFKNLKTYTKTGTLRSGDSFLVCSDGLYNYIPEEALRLVLSQHSKNDPEELVMLLRNAIPKGSASDNVSAVFAHFIKKAYFSPVTLITLFFLVSVFGAIVLREQVSAFYYNVIYPLHFLLPLDY